MQKPSKAKPVKTVKNRKKRPATKSRAAVGTETRPIKTSINSQPLRPSKSRGDFTLNQIMNSPSSSKLDTLDDAIQKQYGHDEQMLALRLAQQIFENTSNIVYTLVVRVENRTYLMFGEYHTELAIDDFVWMKELRTLCDTTPIDIFVEDNFWYRHQLRVRQKTFDDINRDLRTVKHNNNSLNFHRIVSQVACDTFRVHAVDVRDQGFMEFYFTIVPKMEASIDKAGGYVCTTNKACQNLVYNYSITLQTNLSLVASLARKNIAKGLHNTQETASSFVRANQAQIKKAIRTRDLANLWTAYAKLVDLYMLPRMCRADNNDLCIFYGGASHARLTGSGLKAMPGAKVLFERQKNR